MVGVAGHVGLILFPPILFIHAGAEGENPIRLGCSSRARPRSCLDRSGKTSLPAKKARNSASRPDRSVLSGRPLRSGKMFRP